MGYEIARAHADDGKELVILQTAPHKPEVSPAHMLEPVSTPAIAFEIRVALAAAIERARFFGLDPETVSKLFDEELNKEG